MSRPPAKTVLRNAARKTVPPKLRTRPEILFGISSLVDPVPIDSPGIYGFAIFQPQAIDWACYSGTLEYLYGIYSGFYRSRPINCYTFLKLGEDGEPLHTFSSISVPNALKHRISYKGGDAVEDFIIRNLTAVPVNMDRIPEFNWSI